VEGWLLHVAALGGEPRLVADFGDEKLLLG
jgi:hypothetical protein